VDSPPHPGETIFGDSFATIAGGKGLNQAVAAARAGAAVRFIGCVGEDAFGDQLISIMDSEGIGRRTLRRVPGATGTAHITVDSTGQNSIIVVSAANSHVSAADFTNGSTDGLGWLVTQLELPQPAVRGALAHARSRGVRTVLTPAPASRLPEDLLGTVDLLVPNQFEAAVLTGESDPRIAAAVLSRVCGDVVVTLGGDGAVWARGGQVMAHVPGRSVSVVDTTAAGDTYVGVLVAECASGAGFREALEAATAAAAIAVGRPGATASMPSGAEIDDALGRHAPPGLRR
jgi:ribokinase